jgi:hypothetical protein
MTFVTKRPEPYTITLLDWFDVRDWLLLEGYNAQLLSKLTASMENRGLNIICYPEDYENELRPIVECIRAEFANILTRYGYLQVNMDW